MLQDGRKDGVVFENETTLVMIDSDWVVLGHVLIFWKKHVENISDLTSDEYQNFSLIVYKTEGILRHVLG
jgi:diadenosine tetraphosphate (Ap4A) HIT family hydrolase